MMRGLAEALENHHRVRILAEAVEDAVRLSHRYISGRQLPDKSVSVLDTACARVAIGQGATPASVEDAQRRIDQLTTEMNALEREEITGLNHNERIAELKALKTGEEARLANLKAQWEKERGIIEQIRDVRGQPPMWFPAGPEFRSARCCQTRFRPCSLLRIVWSNASLASRMRWKRSRNASELPARDSPIRDGRWAYFFWLDQVASARLKVL